MADMKSCVSVLIPNLQQAPYWRHAASGQCGRLPLARNQWWQYLRQQVPTARQVEIIVSPHSCLEAQLFFSESVSNNTLQQYVANTASAWIGKSAKQLLTRCQPHQRRRLYVMHCLQRFQLLRWQVLAEQVGLRASHITPVQTCLPLRFKVYDCIAIPWEQQWLLLQRQQQHYAVLDYMHGTAQAAKQQLQRLSTMLTDSDTLHVIDHFNEEQKLWWPVMQPMEWPNEN